MIWNLLMICMLLMSGISFICGIGSFILGFIKTKIYFKRMAKVSHIDSEYRTIVSKEGATAYRGDFVIHLALPESINEIANKDYEITRKNEIVATIGAFPNKFYKIGDEVSIYINPKAQAKYFTDGQLKEKVSLFIGITLAGLVLAALSWLMVSNR